MNLTEQRDKLLKEAKQAKVKDYQAGYVDGILDMFSSAIKEGEEKALPLPR